MKSIILSLSQGTRFFKTLVLVCVLLSTAMQLYAQDTLHAPVPFSTFPLGAVRGYRSDTIERMIGANCVWSFGALSDSGSKLMYLGWNAYGGSSMLRPDPFYYSGGIHNVPVSNIYAGAALGQQVTVFMPGTSGPIAEYTNSWQSRTGAPDSGIGAHDPNQWKIQATDSVAGSNYVLTNLSDEARFGVFYGAGHAKEWMDSTHIDSASYEFVCYLDFTGFPLPTNTPLFTIEYWGRTSGDTTWQLLDSTQITYDSYNAQHYALPPYTGHPCLADSLGLWTKRGEIVANTYRVFKKMLYVRPLYNHNFSWAPPSNPAEVDVRVRTYHQWPIFVRCLRIRDWAAYKVLTGQVDNDLNAVIDSFKFWHASNGIDSNMLTQAWGTGTDEPGSKYFHTLAYLNELIVKRGGRPLTAMATNDYALFTRIWRSQTNTSPQCLLDDIYPFAGASWRTFDKIGDSARRRYDDIDGYGNHHPYPPMQADITPDSANAAQTTIPVISDYNLYTKTYQDSILGYAADDGTGYGWSQDYHDVGMACVAIDQTNPMPYILMGHAALKKIILRRAYADSMATIKFGSQFDLGFPSNTGAYYADSLNYAKFILPYLNRLAVTAHPDSIAEDSISDIIWMNRAPTRSEMMLQGWEGVLAGMKAYLLNIADDDFLDQMGIVSTIDGKKDIKSFQRKNIIFDQWRTDPFQGFSYLEPWSLDSGLKTHTYNVGLVTKSIQYRYQDTLARTHEARFPFLGPYDDAVAFSTGVSYLNFKRSDTTLIPLDPYFAFGEFYGSVAAVRTYRPLPPAYGGMFDGARIMIHDEIGSIAATLSKLVLRGMLSWHKRSHSLATLSRLPVDSIKTRTIASFGSVADPDSMTYVDVSYYTNLQDSVAMYVAIQNRRIWMDTNLIGAKGKIDYRLLTFKVRPAAFNSMYSSWPTWSVRDVAGKLDTVVQADSAVSIILQPGQGKLLRIAPSVSITTGTMTSNRWNNQRHIAYDETLTNSLHTYYETYEKKGNILLSSPLEQAGGDSRRTVGTPADSLIEGCGKAHNPALTFNPYNGQGIGLAYSIDHSGSTGDSTYIIFRHSPKSAPYTFSSRDTLAKFKVTNSSFVAAPSIAPIRWKPTGRPAYTYWVSWHDPLRGAAIILLDTLGIATPIKYFNGGGIDSATASFISLASRVDSTARPICHVAFQMDTSVGTHIYYCQARVDTSSPLTSIVIDSTVRISKGLTWCFNRTPSITTDIFGVVSVTWEALHWTPTSDKSSRTTHYVVLRHRDASSKWLDFTTYNAYAMDEFGGWGSWPWPNDTVMLLPNNTLADLVMASSFGTTYTIYSDIYRIGWNNNSDNQMRVARMYVEDTVLTFPYPPGPFHWPLLKTPVERVTEYGLEPALPVRTQGLMALLEPIDFRSPFIHPDSTFDAKVTRYDVPLVPSKPDHSIIHTMAASSGDECPWQGLFMRSGRITNTPALSAGPSVPIEWEPVDTGWISGTHHSVTWSNPRVTTFPFTASGGDSLSYGRIFRVGTYALGDTAGAASALNPAGDYLRASINLRKYSDNSIVQVLDTARLTALQFVSSTALADSGFGHIVIPYSDTFYITMELVRGDSTDHFALSHIESFDDSVVDAVPKPCDTCGEAFKAAPGSPISPASVAPMPDPLQIHVYPNPAMGSTRVCVEALPSGLPALIEVVDANGNQVAVLYNDTPIGDIGFCVSFNCTQLPAGTYFVRVQNSIMGKAVKLQVIK